MGAPGTITAQNLGRITIPTDNVFGDNTAEEVAQQTPAMSGSPTTGYTGTVTFTAATLDNAALSLAGTAKVGVLAGQTAAINGETRDIELNGGTVTGLSNFTGTLIVKSTLDAAAGSISGGAVSPDKIPFSKA